MALRLSEGLGLTGGSCWREGDLWRLNGQHTHAIIGASNQVLAKTGIHVRDRACRPCKLLRKPAAALYFKYPAVVAGASWPVFGKISLIHDAKRSTFFKGDCGAMILSQGAQLDKQATKFVLETNDFAAARKGNGGLKGGCGDGHLV